uniref:Ubiquitin carboxyl-terminal hydrolase n=1 Tax=Pygocentrus nattereri TaxID=42514 RepID=A0AAR2IPS3_PYGNA
MMILPAAMCFSLDQAKDDLQTAIELSLQESQQAQAEERELHSAEENAAQVKRKRSEASGESCSPADWIRQEGCPVGIRNVGNTCWFSAVIQSLFHLPVFRRLVLNYCLSERVLEKCKSHSEKRNIAFMQELRCLFALMVGSNRRFVDPSAAVELLRDAFRTSEAQQDVSEFTHKLLDWLEDAFQLAANGSNPEDKQDNPMVQLFYGTFVAQRVHDGKTLSTIEQFGQYPLQVNGFNNLDECLEGAMVEGEIESLHCDQTVSSGQERWFSKLPPVLTFELSRFEFNQSLGRPEKIHKKLEFPQVMYMDRYLHRNVEQTHGRRGEVKRLKDQLTVLQQKLESYKNYGSGPTKYPLADMLQYVLEFATTKPTNTPPSAPAPANSPSHTETDSENTSTIHIIPFILDVMGQPTSPHLGHTPTLYAGSSNGSDCTQTATQRTPIHKPFTQCRPPMDGPLHPAPHSVTEEELHFVRSCLTRWRTEWHQFRLQHLMFYLYQDCVIFLWCLQVPYRLHAVLVHEGQASAGHYWAYIYDHTRKCWLKYNDVMVTESTWEELVRDSYGGMTNASAYCLMYINDRLPHLIAEDTDDETGQVLQGMDSLPPILRRYVREDNRWFQQELREWEEQFCQASQEEPSAPSEHNNVNSEEPSTEPQHPKPEPTPESNQEQSHEAAEGAVAEPARQVFDQDGPEAGLIKAFHEEYSRLYELSQEETTPHQDPRLQHVLVYFFQNKAPNPIIERTLLEQFGDRNLSFDDRAVSIMREARAKLRLIRPEDMDMEEYLQWQDDYSMFKTVFAYLLTGLEQYQNGKIREALIYLAHAYQDNTALLKTGERKGVDQTLIALYRRKCLKVCTNESYISIPRLIHMAVIKFSLVSTLFKTGEENDVEEAVTIMNDCVIPCMHLMVRDSISQEDMEVIEAIRNHWCSYLEQDMDESLQEKLSEFLPRVLDCSAERVVLKEPPKVRKSPHDLCSRLAAVMESIHSTSIVTVK